MEFSIIATIFFLINIIAAAAIIILIFSYIKKKYKQNK